MEKFVSSISGYSINVRGFDDYQNETIIRKSSELLECLKRTIVVSDDCSSGEHNSYSLPVDIKRKSQKELDEMFHDRVDALFGKQS